jgi:iron-sulfur cluster assembly protein
VKQDIELTDTAIAQLKIEFEKRQNIDGLYLRLGCLSGGCSGFKYLFEFSNKDKRKNDTEFTFDTIKIVVDSKSLAILKGTTLDYKSSLMSKGFTFTTPQAKGHCGCKKSFSI